MRYVKYDDIDYQGEAMVGQTNLYKRGAQFVLDRVAKADSVDIVRCRECKYWNRVFKGCMRNPCTEPWLATDFCSYGEREGE